jgi:hypothetical protein
MDDRDGRGQLLLVAALGLAVAFVVLAVVLNAVVFTENLATQNHGRTDDAVAFQNAVDDGVGGLLVGVNDHDNSDYAELSTAFRAGVGRWSANTSLLAASDGRIAETTVASVENGTQVIQSESRAFTNENGLADWTAATGVEETRRFRMVVSQTDSANPFRAQVSNGSETWTVQVEENGTATDVTVLEDGTPQITHTETGDTVEIDLTEGSVNGTEYENWTFAAGVPAGYDISYENGDTATGRYVFVVDRLRVAMLDDLPADTYYSRNSGEYPTTIPAIYRANLSVSVLRSTLTYETSVDVAPEESPAGEDYTVGGDPPAYSTDVLFVDPDTGNLVSISRSHEQTFDATDVTVLGPRRIDFDGDARKEVPYVNGSNALRVIDANNRTQTWRTSSSANSPVGSKSHVAVGQWERPHISVLYANQGETDLYSARNATEPSRHVHYSGNGVGLVAGVGDVDGDGNDELVFGDTSQQLRYVDDDGTEEKIVDGGYGSNDGPGVGTPRDFDGDGKDRVPFVDGSNNLKLVDANGNVTTVVDSNEQNVAKSMLAPTDWDDDGELEIMFISDVNSGAGKLYYADNVTSGGDVKYVSADLDGDGDSGVDVDTDVGLA